MAIKNRPTLIQQFSDFVNRIAPFNVEPLIQKLELNQVEDDLFDSVLLKLDAAQLINSPSAAIPMDFTSVDLYNVNSSGSVPTVFTITISGLSTGQSGRINITKKSNDTFSFSNADIIGVQGVSQSGTTLNFIIHNVGGTFVAVSDLTINKSNVTNSSDTNQLATSAAVNSLRGLVNAINSSLSGLISGLDSSKLDKSRFNIATGSSDLAMKKIDLGARNLDTTASFSVSHGLTTTSIVNVWVTIISDVGVKTDLLGTLKPDAPPERSCGAWRIDGSSISITRRPSSDGGAFDSAAYSSLSVNRGFITILYTQ